MTKKATNRKRKTAGASRSHAKATNQGSKPNALAKPTRAISAATTLHLYARAGGRCEFDGCNKYLMENHVTASIGNFAEKAHIYAFSVGGPRGGLRGRPAGLNEISNLMLLCNDCHHEVDSVRPDDFPVAVLQKFKKDHEDRIYRLTGIGKDRGIVPLIVKGRIGTRGLEISDEEMQSAVAPNYLRIRDRIEVDLSSIPDTPTDDFRRTAVRVIDEQLDALERLNRRPGGALRLSVFGIAPIPLLVYVGSCLSDKRYTELFRRHRTKQPAWSWVEGRGKCEFKTSRASAGTDEVALLINVSGVNAADVFGGVLRDPTVYELTLDGVAPGLDVVATRGDLERFIGEYQRAIGRIRAEHPELRVLHLLAAAPAPVAIAIGINRLPKVDPELLVYDVDHREGGLTAPLTINR